MAISDAVQTLSAAFSFGILLQASSGTLFLYYKGHGSTIFQDGRRLVLALFLLFAALWAQIDFLNLLLPITSTIACQATLVFSTMFDQLARVVMEQFLLWSVGHRTKLTAERLVLQVILLFRLVVGGLLVGFTRPDFAPVCVARTAVLPIAILVLVLDVVIIGVLMIRALSLGMFRDLREKDSSPKQEQNRALIISIAVFTVWTGTSVAMILGIPSIILILRTVLPANGLLILVGIVTMFLSPLMLAREEEAIAPEARSPFVAPMPPSREMFRENVASNGSPISGQGYTKSGGLFVVNPSATPRDSPTTMFQGNTRSDTKGFTKLGEEVTAQIISRGASGRPDGPEAMYGPGYRGSSGVFPSVFTASESSNTGGLAPQIRPNISLKTQDLSTSLQQKRSLFSWAKAPAKANVRSLAISQPVTANVDGSALKPLPRMQTTDLVTAAVNERKRREDAAARSRLVANRPPPQPPGISTNEALRRSISVKRKEMPSRTLEAMPTVAASSASRLSVEAVNGSTTSASLSPGREDVRRRSPRNANSFDISIDEKPVQLPLQRKGTIGLSSNPRSQRITMAREIGMPREQTVMFMNDIVYDDPGMVKNIISRAPGMSASAKKSHKTSEKSSIDSTGNLLHSSNSIIDRPRPYKRDIEKQRALFPSEPSPGHRRSRSGSSIVVRKSFFTSNPGSPTLLPPLPRPPTSASKLTRLLPNNTKSMTFDEKIQLLFPAPPGPISSHNRRSSVPSLPRAPSVFISESPQAQSPAMGGHPSQRASKRTTIASFGIPDMTALDGSPRLELSRQEERRTYRFSANTYRSIADQVGETWIPGIPPKEVEIRSSIQQPAPMPSMYDMRQSHFTEATTSDESSQDDSTTYWGSLHSEIPPVDLSKAMQNAQTTIILGPGARAEAGEGKVLPRVPQVKHIKEEEMMTMMLDSEETARTFLSEESGHNRGSFFLDADQALPGDKTPTTRNLPSWHRRIGDELPTFSERKSNARTRKMPPPTPLLLSKNGRRAKVIVRAAEPSPPADSPERAIQEIQAQLKRFEEPSRGSVGSLLRHLPDAASTGVDEQDPNGRLRLLENLEKEMGEQQDQWQQMQTNLDRDSVSVVMSPQAELSSKGAMSRQSSQGSVQTPTGVLSRRARIRSSMTVRSKGEDSSRTNSTASSDNSRASVWQQRLAEAQIAYVENAPDLLRKRSLNFLSISKAQHQQLGSPTPPDSETDLETDFQTDSENEGASENISKELYSLWQPPPASPKAGAGRMWNPPCETSIKRPSSPQLPAQNVRPAQRRLDYSLPIYSFNLWSKPRSSNHSRAVVGLWGSRPVRPRSIVTRRATQRPQRRLRRMTFLPDIIESPVPVPNKRDTLGIFQFPWGETSDQPVYRPALDLALLTGPAINAKLDARSRQLEPESEYASSFFDDYDNGEIDPESDDDFDESTLWEIANLLNSKDIPSKNSLLPPGRAEIIEEYDESDSDSEQTYSNESSKAAPTMSLPIQPLSVSPKKNPQLWAHDVTSAFSAAVAGLPEPEPSIWKALISSSDDVIRSKPRTSDALPVLTTRDLWTVPGLEVNDATSSMWSGNENLQKSSAPAQTSGVKSANPMWAPQARSTEDRSSDLFSAPIEGSDIHTTEAAPAAIKIAKAPDQATNNVPKILSQNMWTPIQNLETVTELISKSNTSENGHAVACSSLLWVPPAKMATVSVSGLFGVSHPRSDYRTSQLPPAGINMICKPHKALGPLSELTSSRLWNGCKKLPIEHHWISESTVRPESPSVYSTTSSGRSSPASDASSAKSISTKASSLWGFIGSVAPTSVSTWWDGKNANKPGPTSSGSETKHTLKVQVRQPSLKHLTPLRESRVSAARDIWESRAPVLDTPAKKVHKRAAGLEVAPVVKPLRHQYRSNVTFRADWDEALAQSILGGTPKKSLTRFVASTADWESALAEAVALGQVTKHSKFDPSMMHPVFFTDSFVSSAIDVHPAAIGYVTKSKHYDASVLHPVFFTECLSSNASEVHPAALGHLASKKANGAMWTTSSLPTGSEHTPLWSKNASKACDASAHPVEQSSQAVRKALPMKPLNLPALQSTNVWQPVKDSQEQRHWLITGSAQPAAAQTWVPRAHSSQSNVSGSFETIPIASDLPSTSEIFSHVKGSDVKQSPSRPAALERLNTNALFSKNNIESCVTHWLHKTSTPESAVKKSIIWTALPGKQSAKSENMWNAGPAFDPSSHSPFCNPHTHSWNRKKREDASLKKIESSEMWRQSYGVPESPKNWLLNRRVSKVEFRY